MSQRHAPKSSTYNIGLRVAFHYSSQLQTWSKTWSQTCVSVSQAGRKPAANLLKTRWFLQSRVWRDLSRSSTYRSQYMEDADDIVQSLPTCLYCARCLQFRCRDDVSGQEETETLQSIVFLWLLFLKLLPVSLLQLVRGIGPLLSINVSYVCTNTVMVRTPIALCFQNWKSVISVDILRMDVGTFTACGTFEE